MGRNHRAEPGWPLEVGYISRLPPAYENSKNIFKEGFQLGSKKKTLINVEILIKKSKKNIAFMTIRWNMISIYTRIDILIPTYRYTYQ